MKLNYNCPACGEDDWEEYTRFIDFYSCEKITYICTCNHLYTTREKSSMIKQALNYKKVKCPKCEDELILKSKDIGSEIRAEGFCYNCGYRWVDSTRKNKALQNKGSSV